MSEAQWLELERLFSEVKTRDEADAIGRALFDRLIEISKRIERERDAARNVADMLAAAMLKLLAARGRGHSVPFAEEALAAYSALKLSGKSAAGASAPTTTSAPESDP